MTDQPSNNFPSDVFYPPNELVDTWANKYEGHMPEWVLRHLAAEAAQWGADQELKTCCSYFEDHLREGLAIELRIARRPKPPSLKEQALAVLDDCSDRLDGAHENIIRSALEELPND